MALTPEQKKQLDKLKTDVKQMNDKAKEVKKNS